MKDQALLKIYFNTYSNRDSALLEKLSQEERTRLFFLLLKAGKQDTEIEQAHEDFDSLFSKPKK